MNWYKQASFVDNIRVHKRSSDGDLSISIGAEHYEYEKVPDAVRWGDLFDRLRLMRNKQKAGMLASAYLRNLKQYLKKKPEFHQ